MCTQNRCSKRSGKDSQRMNPMIQPKVNDLLPSQGRCCREESIVCRLHNGHTFLSHFNFLKVRNLRCAFHEQYTVKHLFIKCINSVETQ